MGKPNDKVGIEIEFKKIALTMHSAGHNGTDCTTWQTNYSSKLG